MCWEFHALGKCLHPQGSFEHECSGCSGGGGPPSTWCSRGKANRKVDGWPWRPGSASPDGEHKQEEERALSKGAP